MKIEYVYGDLMQCKESVIAQNVNTKRKMNAGIAKNVRERYPIVYKEYCKNADAGKLTLGSVQWVFVNDKTIKYVINVALQENYGRKTNIVYADYDAIEKAFTQINEDCFDRKIYRIAAPLIGAGLARGSWEIISHIIEKTSTNFQPVIYLIDGKIPI